MFEKHFGRKQNPKLTVEHAQVPETSTKAWRDQTTKEAEFTTWFSGSVVADGDGRPVPVFHGTRGSHAFEDVYKGAKVSEFGIHFGSVQAANDRFADTFENTATRGFGPEEIYEMLRDRAQKSGRPADEVEQELAELELEFQKKKRERDDLLSGGVLGGEKIYPVFLRIVNPVRVSDPGSFTEHNLPAIKKDLIKNFITRGQVDSVQKAKTVEELRTALIGLGYDGVVYKNSVEGRDGDSYIPIVGPEQIRFAISS